MTILYSFKTSLGFFTLNYQNNDLYGITFSTDKPFIESEQATTGSHVFSHLSQIENEIRQYLNGERKQFGLNRHLNWLMGELAHETNDTYGTPFQKKVWRALITIPYGTVISCSDVAGMIAKPKAIRAVANAIAANPLLIVVPCHRVIRNNGRLGGFSAGVDLKIKWIEMEKAVVSHEV